MFKKYFKSELFRNIYTIVSGTVIAQLIPIFLQPLLRRLYLPEDFGVLSVYSSILSIVTVFLTLRYSQAINIPKNEILAKNLFALSVLFSLSISVVLFIIVIIFNKYIINFIGVSEKYSNFLFFIPLSGFVFSLYETINFWLIRKKEFKKSAINKILRRFSEGVVNIFLGYNGNRLGLIIGDFGGNIINILSGIYQLKNINFSFQNISIKKISFSFVRFLQMPKYNLFPHLLNTLCLALPALFINKIYSSQIAGYFNLTLLVLNIPIVLIGNSISEVLLQAFSEKRNSNLSIKRVYNKILLILSVVALFMLAFILLFGEWIFSFIFGNQWYISGEYAKIYVWGAAIRLIASPLNIIFITFEKLKSYAKWQITYFIFIFSLGFMGFLNFNQFLILLTIINAFFYFIILYMSQKVILSYELKIINK